MRLLALSLFVLTVLCGVTDARAENPRSYETRGTLTRFQDGQIAQNIWANTSRDEALELIRAIPQRFTSPIYFELARRLLLSDAPAFGPDKVQKKTDDGKPLAPKPDILIERIDKLLEIGALRDAQTLYDAVVADVPDSFDLAYRNLIMLMLRGQLSAACLDVQAMQPQHGADARWQEFSRFCRIQFTTGAEREKLIASAKFEVMPKLKDYLRGRAYRDVTALKTEDLAYAVATGSIGASSIGLLASKAGAMQPLLLAVLQGLDTPESMPQKTCLAIEAARRGLLGTRDLITLYEKPHFDSDLLLNITGTSPTAANVHPCLIPTVLYQRIASNLKDPALRDRTIRESLDVMKDLPDAAFWPMALYYRDFDVKAPANKKYLWRLANIVAYEKGDLPESWLSGWGKEGSVSPFWPVEAITHPGPMAKENLKAWRTQWPAEAKRVKSQDPIIPLLLSDILSSATKETAEKTKNKVSDYENIFSLTFSRSYAMPSYGLTQRLTDVIEKEQTGQSVALLLIGYGAIPPDQVIPHQMALVIDGMNRSGLVRYARRFALEVLQ
ncbi:MAG: hypothetical protein EBQ96_09210 [Proteobacteria bacterium]|nr:hypothetical protein [Pseudomonadota bacterium]